MSQELLVCYIILSCSVGASNVSVGKFVGAICKLLGDANSQVSNGYYDNKDLVSS